MSAANGGPAFPSPGIASPARGDAEELVQQGAYDGMTLRIYFAAKAMHALILAWNSADGIQHYGGESASHDIARAAYEHADAMIAEGAKK